MKNQAISSSKDKSKKLKRCLLQFLFGALRDNLLGNLPLPSFLKQNVLLFFFHKKFAQHLLFLKNKFCQNIN